MVSLGISIIHRLRHNSKHRSLAVRSGPVQGMVAADLRRRMLARRTLPPRYFGGYGSREGSPSRFRHSVGNHFEFSERLRVGALHGGQLVAPARLVRLSFGTKALTRTRRRAAAPNPPWR